MCDGALTAFRDSVRAIQSSAKLQAYNSHEEIAKYFEGDYTTQLGYGLNFGWAIEGAVGTSIKIDCSYLSPNVLQHYYTTALLYDYITKLLQYYNTTVL